MLFKYSGKYVNIYFNMKITYLAFISFQFCTMFKNVRLGVHFRAYVRMHTYVFTGKKITFTLNVSQSVQ